MVGPAVGNSLLLLRNPWMWLAVISPTGIDPNYGLAVLKCSVRTPLNLSVTLRGDESPLLTVKCYKPPKVHSKTSFSNPTMGWLFR